MRKIFILIVLNSSFFAFVKAQNFKIDNRLTEAFPPQYIEELRSQNPDQLLFLNFFLDNAWYIDKLPQEKLSDIKSLKSLENTDELTAAEIAQILSDSNRKKEFNILKYKIERNPKGETVYKINEDGLVLIIYNNDFIMQGFNQYRNQLNK
jgi:hypothetical protein